MARCIPGTWTSRPSKASWRGHTKSHPTLDASMIWVGSPTPETDEADAQLAKTGGTVDVVLFYEVFEPLEPLSERWPVREMLRLATMGYSEWFYREKP